MKRLAAGLIAGGMMLGLGACGETGPAPRYETELTEVDLFASGNIGIVRPGDTVLIEPETSFDLRERFLQGIQLIEFQYEHGLEDENAPTVSNVPIRIDSHVALTGKSPELSNDLACDTINIELNNMDTERAHIGALALSDSVDDRILVSWPVNSDQIYVCFDDGAEAGEGVVLFVSDRQR